MKGNMGKAGLASLALLVLTGMAALRGNGVGPHLVSREPGALPGVDDHPLAVAGLDGREVDVAVAQELAGEHVQVACGLDLAHQLGDQGSGGPPGVGVGDPGSGLVRTSW